MAMKRQYSELCFRDFLSELNGVYSGDRLRLLRFLLHDYLSISVLARTDISAFDLFNGLEDRGHISPTEVKLLSEIAKVTKLKAAQTAVEAYLKDVKGGTGLSVYRKVLFTALTEVTEDDMRKLRAFYKLDRYAFGNIWDLVFHLEKELLLDNTEEKIKRFADKLNPAAANEILGKLSTLKEAEDNLQSTSSTEQGLDAGTDVSSVPKELTSKEFKTMILKTSNWYQKGDKLTMLRLLFKDKIDDATKHQNVKSLFDDLMASATLKRTDYKVIIDMIKITDTRGVVEEVKSLSDANKNAKITSFSAYRQTLMEMGKVLSPEEAKQVGFQNDVPDNEYTDQWSLIMHLEKTTNVFADGVEEFIEDLKDIGLHHVALKLQPIANK